LGLSERTGGLEIVVEANPRRSAALTTGRDMERQVKNEITGDRVKRGILDFAVVIGTIYFL
jgi:hypothetical protein